LFAVLRSITRSGKPLAFLDEIGALKRAPLPADLATVRAFEMATSTGGGQVVGRYLYNLGHRRVAALCGSPGAFGRERALGLASAMRTAGVSDAVHILESTSRRSLDEPRVTIRLSTNLGAAVDKRLNGAIPSIFIAEQKIHLALAVRRELQRPLHQPLFERALAMPGVSAWVTDTDAFALDALSFLAGRGVRVPQDLSVVGFDDSLEAAFYRLSSYNFNGAAVTDAMLAYLLKPGRAVGQSRAPEIEGYVTERATTGKAR
jgi:DNA-binding LacI/PurR family transcriptional regulator